MRQRYAEPKMPVVLRALVTFHGSYQIYGCNECLCKILWVIFYASMSMLIFHSIQNLSNYLLQKIVKQVSAIFRKKKKELIKQGSTLEASALQKLESFRRTNFLSAFGLKSGGSGHKWVELHTDS